MKNLHDIKIINSHKFTADSSFLMVFEQDSNVPFEIKRVFTVSVQKESVRGFHAHKQCAQLLILLHGSCVAICDDGENRQQFQLNNPGEGILIPPTIWGEQQYSANSSVIVLTDMKYSEDDYIRNYRDFLMFREKI